MDLVTVGVNTRRGESGKTSGYQWRPELIKTHCIQGHEYTPENTRWTTGAPGKRRRDCVTCSRLRRQAWSLRQQKGA